MALRRLTKRWGLNVGTARRGKRGDLSGRLGLASTARVTLKICAQRRGSDEAEMMKFGVGQPLRRFEDRRLLTGRGRFQDDVALPQQGYAGFGPSPHAPPAVTAVGAPA